MPFHFSRLMMANIYRLGLMISDDARSHFGFSAPHRRIISYAASVADSRRSGLRRSAHLVASVCSEIRLGLSRWHSSSPKCGIGSLLRPAETRISFRWSTADRCPPTTSCHHAHFAHVSSFGLVSRADAYWLNGRFRPPSRSPPAVLGRFLMLKASVSLRYS